MLIFFLACLFALAGYWLGKSSTIHPSPPTAAALNKNYFIGLNYLLNDQPDKALQLLIQSLSVDSDTIETHLALGSLFRKRGELSRAIRIHQNLIARPNLTVIEKNQAMLALAYDYLAAGVLDRAEQSFWIVTEDPTYRTEAYVKLIDIYQQERRWLQAIEVALRLKKHADPQISNALAHFHCERASVLLKEKKFSEALVELTNAKKHQRRLSRVYLLMGDSYLQQQEVKQALNAYQQVQEIDPDYLSEAIPKIVHCYQQLNSPDAFGHYLEHTYQQWPRATVSQALFDYYRQHHSMAKATAFLTTELARQPAPSLKSLLQWIAAEQQQEALIGDHQQQLTVLNAIAVKLLQHKPVYRCSHCGFAGRILFWLCPGCKHWGSIKPIHGVEGDG